MSFLIFKDDFEGWKLELYGMNKKQGDKWMHHFRRENLRLNEHFPLTEDEFKNLLNRFKEAYVAMKLKSINQEEDVLCIFEKEICPVKESL